MIKSVVIVAFLVVTTYAIRDADLDVWLQPDSADSILYKAQDVVKTINDRKPIAENLTEGFDASIEKISLTKMKSCSWYEGLFFTSSCKEQNDSNMQTCRECSSHMEKVCMDLNEDFIGEVEPKAESLVYEVSWLYTRMEELKQNLTTKTEELRSSQAEGENLKGALDELKFKFEKKEEEVVALKNELDRISAEAKILNDEKQADIEALKLKFDECEATRRQVLNQTSLLIFEKMIIQVSLRECEENRRNSTEELNEMREKLRNTERELEHLRNGEQLVNTRELLSAIEKLQKSVNELMGKRNVEPEQENPEGKDTEKKTLGEKILDRTIFALRTDTGGV